MQLTLISSYSDLILFVFLLWRLLWTAAVIFQLRRTEGEWQGVCAGVMPLMASDGPGKKLIGGYTIM